MEINNNLQGINSRMDEAENQINDLEHKEAKKKTNKKKQPPNQNKKKKESKKRG